ncbi:MAG: TlyA family rRNA (cytidine-2'-O)-methyltransferase [Clostridiales bacterium]|nr:TlyA family rRNA (cytidine-2'-O)-methyltransferase [Clostridiales bacterium]
MKTRLDVALFERGLAKSREEAHALVLAGQVYLGEVKAEKAGQFVTEDAQINVRGDTCPFVSRGGYKLKKALDTFPITLTDKTCADIGASTGGFTDCMLQHGAKKVYAIDVGYGQLDWKLRSDERVVTLERTNARFMEQAWFEGGLDFASIDVSFISLDKILPPLISCLTEGGQVVALIKPQFEAGRNKVGKHGVVSEESTHVEVIDRVLDVAHNSGYCVRGLTYSPIRGPKGNIEFLLYLEKCIHNKQFATEIDHNTAISVVDDAHNSCI